MAGRIRWGIVGPGFIANKFAKAIQNVEEAELVAVASRSKERATAFAQDYHIPNVFTGYDEMAESDLIDAVYIATIHPQHKACAELFLKAKKHVLCEKPLCVNARQAEELIECARENKVFLMEGMWTRFLPAIQEAQRLVQQGEIGVVRGMDAAFCYSSTPEIEEKLFLKELAGGSLLDVGIYGLHFASIFFGNQPLDVCSFSHVENGVDTHMNILLKYPDGVVCSIASGIDVLKPESGYVYGSGGYIYLPTFYGAQELYLCVDGRETLIQKPSIGDGFEEEIMEACTCILAGKTESGRYPLTETVAILRLMDEIREKNGIVYPFEIGEEQ